ncbi:MAG: HEPN domain-containing protein [Dyadobacter sp.]|uniref:nucleotidyltransferase domain-containing protein n=1 Tax=Dyadobacter sp. TaxID=1914288 RepID=UPI001B1A001D|nr:nucleotidyltransferase domain-containing protein [Dyadobacter sp.]MBO9615160.1 HEPN domain-containing protein [Dyadobacter sp.]
MKSSLSHLPLHKQTELQNLVEIVLARVPAEMIILFGSYARGEWVEDYQEKYEYVSDFDILVITKDRLSAKRDKKWRELDKELAANKEITKTSIIQHSIGFVNDKIEGNSYFFVDVLKEGILLFDSGNFKLSEPKNMQPEERQIKAKEQFGHWFTSASHFLEGFEMYFQKGEDNPAYYKEAAFLLHQTTERLCTTTLLVFTDYKPKLHDIEELINQTIKLRSDFAIVFPRTSGEEERLFQLLKKAYIDARYEMHYKIEKAELEYLGYRAKLLKDLTERICAERIAQFTTG